MRAIISGALLLLLALLTPTANAGNQDSFALGNEAALSAGAVTAIAGDTGAAWYNPAGLAGLSRSAVDVGASAFVLRQRSAPDALETELPFATLHEDLNSLEVLSVPSALVFVRPLGDGVTGAFGLFVPVQDQLSVSVTDSIQTTGREGDEDGLFEQSFDLDVTRNRYLVGPSVGWALTDRLRLGVAGYGVYEARSQESTLWNWALSSSGRRAFMLRESQEQTTVLGGQLVGGAQWEIGGGFTLGLTLHSPIFLFHAEGSSELLATRAMRSVAGEDDVAVARRDDTLAAHAGQLVSPGRARMGVAWEVAGGWLGLEGDYTPPLSGSKLAPATAPVWNLRVGGVFPVTDTVNVGGGLYTDRSPHREPTEPGDARVDFYGVTTGVQLLKPYPLAESEEPLVFATTLGCVLPVSVRRFVTDTVHDGLDGGLNFLRASGAPKRSPGHLRRWLPRSVQSEASHGRGVGPRLPIRR